MSEAGEGEEEEPKVTLKQEEIASGLSQIDKTFDGSSYVFTVLTLSERDPKLQELGDELEKYSHLRTVDLSKNEIEDLAALARLPHLLTLNAEENAADSADFLGETDAFQFLQIANLS